MQSIKLILVAVKNPGPGSRRTIAKAARLARGLRADLELFHALDTSVHVDAFDTDDRWMEHMQRECRRACSQQLERTAARLRKLGLQVGTAVEWDHPADEAIIRHGEIVGADLIVAERSGGWHIAPSLLHPTEWELLRMSSVPLLLASRSTRSFRHPMVLAAVDPSQSHAKPATLDDEILRTSGTVNDALGGTLHVLHSYRPEPLGMPLEMQAISDIVASIRAGALSEARRAVKRLLTSSGMPVTDCHVVAAPVKDSIRSVVQSSQSSVIVMGAVPRSGLKALFLGNTAEEVLTEMDCDLLVVKPPEFRTRVPLNPRGAHFVTSVPHA